jgi:hypothetical protein
VLSGFIVSCHQRLDAILILVMTAEDFDARAAKRSPASSASRSPPPSASRQ